MSELVAVIHRSELDEKGVKPGLSKVDLSTINLDTNTPDCKVAFMPREVLDDKSPSSIEIGKTYQQILPYFIIRNESNGKILSYYRKGKEGALVGKRSVGVGGHIDINDWNGGVPTPWAFDNFVLEGANRELSEEINLDIHGNGFNELEFTSILINSDPTSAIHWGLSAIITVPNAWVENIFKCDENEFRKVEWLTLEELVRTQHEDQNFEPWSAALINYHYMCEVTKLGRGCTTPENYIAEREFRNIWFAGDHDPVPGSGQIPGRGATAITTPIDEAPFGQHRKYNPDDTPGGYVVEQVIRAENGLEVIAREKPVLDVKSGGVPGPIPDGFDPDFQKR